MKIAVIGAGAMGGSFVEGLLKSETFKPSDITVADPTEAKLEKYAQLGASVTTSNTAAADGPDIVSIVVKPWIVGSVLTEIKDILDYQSQMLIIVAAGVSVEQIKGWLDKKGKVLPFFLVIPKIETPISHVAVGSAVYSHVMWRAVNDHFLLL